MAIPTTTYEAHETRTTPGSWLRRHKRLVWGVCAALVAMLVIGGFFAEKYWPYRYRNVKPLLEQVFASKITVSHYHRTYFPHPGFVAEALTLRRTSAPDLPPVGSTEELIVQGSWLDLLTLRQRVQLVDVVGLHVVIPPVGSRANHEDFPAGSTADFSGPDTMVEVMHIHKAVLDIMRTDGGRYTYPIRDLVIRNLRNGEAISYSVDMQNASPAGRIQATGKFGPIPPKNLGATPLWGDFTFAPVDLGSIGELHGTLSATGHFSGELCAISGYAKASTPDFAVHDGTPVPVNGTVQLTVNGLNRDVILNSVEARSGKTVVEAQGNVKGSPNVTDVDLKVDKGRAEDLLRPFLKERVPIAGVVWLKAHAHLTPAEHGERFLHRLSVDGSFVVPSERVTNRDLEQKLASFSKRAQGDKAEKDDSAASQSIDELSSLEGPVKIRDGIASTPRLRFAIPGAVADLKGTYNLRDKSAHLVGVLRMESDISHTETGFKSALLKPLAPFFKKKKAGAVIPIAVTGKPGHYSVSSNLLHEK